MQLEQLRQKLLSYPESTESLPFGPEALVFKVVDKMFALVSHMDTPLSINLKCDPNDALALRDQYTAVQPGYHMNKKHWNTVILDDSIPEAEIWAMVDHSYKLVVKGLKKADRERLQGA